MGEIKSLFLLRSNLVVKSMKGVVDLYDQIKVVESSRAKPVIWKKDEVLFTRIMHLF